MRVVLSINQIADTTARTNDATSCPQLVEGKQLDAFRERPRARSWSKDHFDAVPRPPRRRRRRGSSARLEKEAAVTCSGGGGARSENERSAALSTGSGSREGARDGGCDNAAVAASCAAQDEPPASPSGQSSPSATDRRPRKGVAAANFGGVAEPAPPLHEGPGPASASVREARWRRRRPRPRGSLGKGARGPGRGQGGDAALARESHGHEAAAGAVRPLASGLLGSNKHRDSHEHEEGRARCTPPSL
jgi:hypothetical protein